MVLNKVQKKKTTMETEPCQGMLNTTPEITMSLVGEWCVVCYDGEAYPGVVQDVDEESVQVKTMCIIGVNRFFWPLKDDILWYRHEHFLGLVPEPKPVTKRHMMLDMSVWNEISSMMDERMTSFCLLSGRFGINDMFVVFLSNC